MHHFRFQGFIVLTNESLHKEIRDSESYPLFFWQDTNEKDLKERGSE